MHKKVLEVFYDTPFAVNTETKQVKKKFRLLSIELEKLKFVKKLLKQSAICLRKEPVFFTLVY